MEIIRDAAAEVDRPLFYAVAVIVVSFLPIYVLSGPSGTLFKPMADTMIFALVGSLIVTLTLLPVLCAWFMRNGVRERRNAAFEAIKTRLCQGPGLCLAHPWGTTLASALLLAGIAAADPRSSAPSSCRSWTKARCGCAPPCPTPSPSTNRRRSRPRSATILRSFPEVTTVASELGRPDDGTDPTGFFNVEFYVGLKPYSQWTGAYHNKAGADRGHQPEARRPFPGITFNYTQPAEDAVDEAETGLKSALAVKVFGSDLDTLQHKGKAIKQVLEQVRGIRDVTLVQELGQPSLTIKIDRAKIARYGINVADINALIQTAIGGDVATQVVQQEKQFDLVVRLEQQYRDNPEEIGNILVATPGGQQIPLKEFADIQVTNGASFIYREDNSRYIGVQFSVEGRDLAGAVEDAMRQVKQQGRPAAGLSAGLGRRIYRIHRLARAAERDPAADAVPDLPAAVRALQQFQVPVHHRAGRAAVGAGGRHRGAVAHRHAVLGVVRASAFWPCSASRCRPRSSTSPTSTNCAATACPLAEAIREGAILRLRPIMMTALVAALGLLPAALATGVGTDSQRPFALVIVSGLFTRLLISVFLMPVLYALVARPDDRLEV